MRRRSLIALAAVATVASQAIAAQDGSLSGNVTADDFLKIYISTDLVADDSDLVLDKTSGWGSEQAFTTPLPAPSVPLYLLIEATNNSGPAMLIGDFTITGGQYRFANGQSTLVTNTVDWTTGGISFAAAAGTPYNMGQNLPGLQIWGQRATISSDAQAVWHYNADWAMGQAGKSYFVTTLTPVPEPASVALMLAGLAALGCRARRAA